MAGLQYNFFPTDFYYPRPQHLVVNDAAPIAAVIVQTPKTEVNGGDLEWPRSLGFRVHQGNNTHGSKAGVSMRQKQGMAYVVGDQGKLAPNPLS